MAAVEPRAATNGSSQRARLLAGPPVIERRLQVAGVSTAVLEGGAGPPIVLLHGPGHLAGMWMRIIPDLVSTHRVIAPDLHGHGTSELVGGWTHLAYSLERARGPTATLAGRLLREFGMPRIPPDHLARITAPTVLIRGRHDRATRLRIAEQNSARYGWPLHVIENCADDPPRDQPRAFLEALRVALGVATKQEPPLSRRLS